MSEKELFMLKCMVEYIEQLSGNEGVYAHKSQGCVTLNACQEWLRDESAKRSVYNMIKAFDDFYDYAKGAVSSEDMVALSTCEDALRSVGSNLIKLSSGGRND